MNTKAAEATESLQGTIEKVIFAAKDTGYTIALMQTEARCVTLAGNLPHIAVAEEIVCEGRWVDHPKYGKQFNAVSYMKVLPTGEDAIEAYLASGMIKGVGPSTAAKIVKAFGAKALDILTNAPHRLMEISGIGEKKCETIARAWKEQTAVQDIMVFLSGCGITPVFATKIYRKYGLDAIRVIEENPYNLSYDISGIGFLSADRIARKIGFAENSPQRIQAGTLYALDEGKKEGHVYFPESVLKSRAVALLEAGGGLVDTAIASLAREEKILVEEVAGQRHVYLPSLYVHERDSARILAQLAHTHSLLKNHMNDVDTQIRTAERKFRIQLSPEQRDAVVKACTNTVSVLTGGPGTGKTLTTRIIVEIFKQKEATILLGAPTGKAAKRLEGCGHDAATLHRLLEFSPRLGGFQRSDKNPLECQLLIVDESSMCDISLFYYLVRAVPLGAHLVIIGDADQLPSVGPGLVLRHLVDSGALPLTVLNQIYRQAEGSGITQLAHSINHGLVPDQTHFGKDCYFVQREDPAQAVSRIVEIVQNLRARGTDCQVISPMHKGDAGTDRLNEALQDALNPVPPGELDTYQVVSGFRKFRKGDRVIQTKNDYDRGTDGVFNGDSGVITSIDHEEQQLDVLFDGRGIVTYEFLDLDQLLLSYCLTVHKCQGSEYDTVVVVCLSQHYVMLARNLMYTAVSRAKKMVILVGSPKAMAISVHNDKQKLRFTRLKERLTGGEGHPERAKQNVGH